jgi:hypothetical protein
MYGVEMFILLNLINGSANNILFFHVNESLKLFPSFTRFEESGPV